MNTELFCFCSFLLYWFFPYYSQLSQLISKKSCYQISEKHDQTYINLINVLFKLCWVWWDQMAVCLYWIYKNYSNAIIYVNELILTQFSPLDIKCKKLMQKTSRNNLRAIFKISRKVSFSCFPKVALDHGERCPLVPFRVFVDHITIFSSDPMQQLRWKSLWQEIGNSWKLLLTDFTDVCLKCDKALLSVSEMHWWT